MQIRYFAILAAMALWLSGCSGMSEQACLSTDWRTVGFEDGVAGRSPATIGNYRQSCSEYGITPDLAEYRAGHEEGVETFCRAGNGFEIGRRGGTYQGVCPANLEPEFLAAYNEGRQLYEFESAVRNVDSQIASKLKRSEELAGELVTVSATIVAGETTPERRAELLLRVAAIGVEQGQLGKDVEALRIERAQREADLIAYRERIAFAAL
jgi:hypothetical protein